MNRSQKVDNWLLAERLIEPVVEKHGFTDAPPHKGIFGVEVPQRSKVDQNLDSIIRVAEWLGEEV